MNRIGLIFSSLLVLIALASSTLFVVDQRQFGVVYALGQIKDVITEPGSELQASTTFSECLVYRQASADAGQHRLRTHVDR
jgi:membrane protease subunit HflC